MKFSFLFLTPNQQYNPQDTV